jgi:hypothetical protein
LARIIIIQHRTLGSDFPRSMLSLLAGYWAEWGHQIFVASGTEGLPEADLAVLHVNLSRIPQHYADAANRYKRVVNGAALDIRKRTVSSNIVARDSDWSGPVIVKTDLNYHGLPEVWVSEAQHAGGFAVKRTAPPPLPDYPIFEGIRSVPDEIWSQPHLVVERFLPERHEEGFCVRTWVFFGERERCRRHLCTEPIVKARNLIASENSPVPDFIRGERERLGFDYGKFDFVIHEGEPILLDANKTPGSPPNSPDTERAYREIAGGIDAMLQG